MEILKIKFFKSRSPQKTRPILKKKKKHLVINQFSRLLARILLNKYFLIMEVYDLWEKQEILLILVLALNFSEKICSAFSSCGLFCLPRTWNYCILFFSSVFWSNGLSRWAFVACNGGRSVCWGDLCCLCRRFQRFSRLSSFSFSLEFFLGHYSIKNKMNSL